MLVSAGASSVTLANVADVVDAPAPQIGKAAIDGKPGVMFYVEEQYGANTLEVIKKVEAALRELKPALANGGIVLHPDLFRPANFINTATGNVSESLLIGGVLVIVVIFLFLFNLRTAAISCAAIPLSLLTATLVLDYLGYTLNTMTLGGLAIAIGVVVDDAVIDIENIVRRLRENARLARPRPAGEASVGERIGQPLSRETSFVPGADAFQIVEGDMAGCATRAPGRPGVVEDPGMCGHSLGGNREISCPASDGEPSWPAMGRRGAVAVDARS